MLKKNDKMIFEERAISTIIMLMVMMVAAQVLSRYMFHKSISFTEEIVRYFFVLTTLLGASAALYRKLHISLSVSFGNSNTKFRIFKRFIAGFSAFLSSAVLVIYGFKVVIIQFATGQKTAAMGYPMWLIGLAVPAIGRAHV